ncbi:MAG: hypothetical protein KBS42_01545, partial [Bacteroidales bacterium]|nr:hypothetical protein [Candidatus Colicola coprequi]
NYKLIPKISLWVLMALGFIFSVMFYVGGSEGTLEVAGDFLNIPAFTNLFLTWNYILVGLVCLITLAVVVYELIKTFQVDKKKALTSLAVVVGFIALVVICWCIGSPEEVKIIGYEGTDNVGAMAQLSDACLWLTYILTIATIITMIGGVIYTKTRK